MTSWYRIEDRRFAGAPDEIGNPTPYVTELRTLELEVLKETPKGAWLKVNGRPRWTAKGATRRFACPTMKEAVESFVARKIKQRRILMRRVTEIDVMLLRVRSPSFSGRIDII